MEAQSWKLLNSMSGDQVVAVIAVIIATLLFIAKNWKDIKQFFNSLYMSRKNKEELLSTIDQNKKDIEQMQVLIGEDRDMFKSLHEEMTSSMNKIFDALEQLKVRQEKEEKKREEGDVIQSRIRILRFASELNNETYQLNEEYFKQILMDIDMYEKYCHTHPDFENNFTVLSVQKIKNAWVKYEE